MLVGQLPLVTISTGIWTKDIPQYLHHMRLPVWKMFLGIADESQQSMQAVMKQKAEDNYRQLNSNRSFQETTNEQEAHRTEDRIRKKRKHAENYQPDTTAGRKTHEDRITQTLQHKQIRMTNGVTRLPLTATYSTPQSGRPEPPT